MTEPHRDGVPDRNDRPAWVRHTDGHWYPGNHRRWRPVPGGSWLATVDYWAPEDGRVCRWYQEVSEGDVVLRDLDEAAPVGQSRDDTPPAPAAEGEQGPVNSL